MGGPQDVLADRVRAAITTAFGAGYSGTDPLIRASAFADFQSNAALPLARQLGRPPRDVAADIAAHLNLAGFCEPPQVSGPGFLNFTFANQWIAAQAARVLDDQWLGARPAGPALTVVVDYSGPNVAKELHVGHLRTTVVGDATTRILEFLGHNVVRAAHLGDWGTQFGMLIEHICDVGEAATRVQLSSGEITAFYQGARAAFDSDPAFAERARRRVAKLQSGDPQTVRLWQVLVSASMRYLTSVYARLGITLTDTDMAPESFYNDMLAAVCTELQEAGIARVSDGALCAFPPGFTGRDGAPLPLLLRKRGGGYGYGATDVAAIRYRLVDLKASRLIYVVGAEQAQHLSMVFAVARQAGWLGGQARAEHAVIGLVTGADGRRLRTRSGEQAKLVALIDEAVARAAHVIAGRYDEPAEVNRIAESVGIGALKYADLSVARHSSYAFDPRRMLSMTGDSGPYLQYAAARIRSIFRKAGMSPAEAMGPIALNAGAERSLALATLGFGAAVCQAADTAEPHVLARFLFDVASRFTLFFDQCPVLKSGSETVRQSRLALSALTLRVLTTGLGLLGVTVPERM